MSVLIVIYLLLDAEGLHGRMLRATPPRSSRATTPSRPSSSRTSRSAPLLGAAAALADTVLLLVLGVPYAVLWGLMSFLFSFVPNIGFILALIPPTVFALARARAADGAGGRRRLCRDQPRVRLRAPAAGRVDDPRGQPGGRRSCDPRLDAADRPRRGAARGAAHDHAARPADAVPGRGAGSSRSSARMSGAAGRRTGRRSGRRTYNRRVIAGSPTRRATGLVSGRVFRRSTSAHPPVAVEAHGSTIVDADGREYLDAAGGAIVVNVGHGRREIADAIADQPAPPLLRARHAPSRPSRSSATPPSVGPHLPMADPAIYPVSRRLGGDRDRAQARPGDAARPRRAGPLDRVRALGELPRQHARRARPLGPPAAAPPVRGAGSAGSGTSARRTRTGATTRARRPWHDPGAGRRAGPGVHGGRARARSPRSSPSRSSGRRSAAVEPPAGYWPAVADVCRRHGALLIADEVMTGFGRTGAWFGMTTTGSSRTCWSRPRARPPATGRSGSSRHRARSTTR